MVLHKPYPIADESKLVVADKNRNGIPTLALPEAAAAFGRMKSAAKQNGVGLIAFSGYRAPSLQKELFLDAQRRHGKRGAARWVAPAGYSEHQTGLAFDIGDLSHPETDDESSFDSTEAFAWLRANAPGFDFELSFPPDNSQGISYEPWHWRYAGPGVARNVFHPPAAVGIARDIRAFLCAVRFQVLP